MASVAVLPHVLLHRTPFGTRIEWRRGAGLLVRDPAGACRPIPPAELRRCYPEAWPAWVRWAAVLPADGCRPGQIGPPGDSAA